RSYKGRAFVALATEAQRHRVCTEKAKIIAKQVGFLCATSVSLCLCGQSRFVCFLDARGPLFGSEKCRGGGGAAGSDFVEYPHLFPQKTRRHRVVIGPFPEPRIGALPDDIPPPPPPPTEPPDGEAAADRFEPLNIADELRDSYLTY